MKRLLTAGALLALALAVSACGSGSMPGTVSSSRLVKDGHIRITATAYTPVRAGKVLRVAVRITNVSKQPRTIQLGYNNLYAVVHTASGTEIDSRIAFPWGVGGPIPLTRLKPGESVTTDDVSGLSVLWNGPLRVTPGWGHFALPELHVRVADPAGPVPSDSAVIADVVASTGHLLDNCRPISSGVPVVGRIAAPPNVSAPPLLASCSIDVRHEHRFDVAQVVILSPPGLSGVSFRERYEDFKGAPKWDTDSEAIAWQFIVTRAGARSIDSTTIASTKAVRHRNVAEWRWTASGRTGRVDRYHCGGQDFEPGTARGPYVRFVSSCRR